MRLERDVSSAQIIRELKKIPYIGQKSAEQLFAVGIRNLDDIKKNKPEKIYEALLKLENTHLDKIMLYVLRCAQYFLKNKNPDPKLLKWWSWKDKE
jgi:replicative superfamily II helicase